MSLTLRYFPVSQIKFGSKTELVSGVLTIYVYWHLTNGKKAKGKFPNPFGF